MQFRIPVHSIIDVITNSSTEIFTTATKKSMEFAKELIDEILSAGGSNKKAEDLFEFKLFYTDDSYENIFENYYDFLKDEEREKDSRIFNNYIEEESYEELLKRRLNIIENDSSYEVDEDMKDYYGYPAITYDLIITYKGEERELPLWKNIFRMLEQWAHS